MDFVSLLLDFSNKRAHCVIIDWQNFEALCVVFPDPRGFKPTEASSKPFCFTRNLPQIASLKGFYQDVSSLLA